MWGSTVTHSQCCRVHKCADMPDLDWTLRVHLRRSWSEVCRWITSLAGGRSCRGTVGWLDGAPGIQHSLRLKRPKMVRNQRPRRYYLFMSATACRSVDTCDVWWYSREWVRGGLNGRGIMLRHPTSAVLRTLGLADVLCVLNDIILRCCSGVTG